MQRVFLKKGREKPVLNGHPWIFSGAIEKADAPENAAGADVFDHKGNWLARGVYNPKSQIRVRVLTWEKEEIDAAFFARRLSQAAALRVKCISPATDGYRLVNGEGDFVPGLVVDRYGEFLVCQFFTAGIDGLKSLVVDALTSLFQPRGIYDRSEGGVRDEEGLPPSVGVLAGEEPPELIQLEENQIRFLVDVRKGQKTGFFLDQRDSRVLLSSLARDMRVLNCFAYTGGFTAYALKAGAKRVVSVESSKPALELAKQTFALNGFSVDDRDLVRGDVFAYLKNRAEEFDIVVLDPPSLAHRRGDVEAAAGGYKFLNLHALRLLGAGGLLLTFSCSSHISADLFQKIVFGAAVDAGRKVQIVKKLGHPPDHPVSLHHPEGEYLKGLLLKVLE
ncbi:MAG TPA: class I SAM-dependent rRNA methyltransferase [Candidatus Binatia bacterium]|jgi:23S rRNA (cytosine1962-C5)-methyltransferase